MTQTQDGSQPEPTRTKPSSSLARVAFAAVLVTGSLALIAFEATDQETTAEGSEKDGDGGDASEASAGDRCDLSFNPAAYWSEAERLGSVTAPGSDEEPHAPHHGDHEPSDEAPDEAASTGSDELDALLSLSATTGELDLGDLVSGLAEADDSVYEDWLDRSPGLATHAGPQPWTTMTDPQACVQLRGELDRVRDIAASHPSPDDARSAGYDLTISYVPGIGSHWLNWDLLDETFEIDEPELLLYDGESSDASVVGVGYIVLSDPEVEPAQGFTGGNGIYHTHETLCWQDGLIVGDSLTSPEDCAARGGVTKREDDRWMLHVWAVPGCESPWGVFSTVNPLLDSAVGAPSDGNDREGCARSDIRSRYNLDPGTSGNVPGTLLDK